jgi:hypothetical protein
MPEFILPAEADHCSYCGKVLRIPPACCMQMAEKYRQDEEQRWQELNKRVEFYEEMYDVKS